MCLSCSAQMAEPVSKQKALQVASQVMGAKSGMRMAPAMNTLKAETVFDKVDAKGNPYMYVVHKKVPMAMCWLAATTAMQRCWGIATKDSLMLTTCQMRREL